MAACSLPWRRYSAFIRHLQHPPPTSKCQSLSPRSTWSFRKYRHEIQHCLHLHSIEPSSILVRGVRCCCHYHPGGSSSSPSLLPTRPLFIHPSIYYLLSDNYQLWIIFDNDGAPPQIRGPCNITPLQPRSASILVDAVRAACNHTMINSQFVLINNNQMVRGGTSPRTREFTDKRGWLGCGAEWIEP